MAQVSASHTKAGMFSPSKQHPGRAASGGVKKGHGMPSNTGRGTVRKKTPGVMNGWLLETFAEAN